MTYLVLVEYWLSTGCEMVVFQLALGSEMGGEVNRCTLRRTHNKEPEWLRMKVAGFGTITQVDES